MWWLAFVGLTPFLAALRASSARRRLLLGLLFGLAFFGATLSWILLFGELAWSALIVMSAGFTAVFGLLSAAVVRPSRPIMSALGIAALWTVMEWLRDLIPLGGFGWGSLGVSQVDNRITLRLASITGVWGVSFVVVAVNALLVEALAGGGGEGERKRRRGGIVWPPPRWLPRSCWRRRRSRSPWRPGGRSTWRRSRWTCGARVVCRRPTRTSPWRG